MADSIAVEEEIEEQTDTEEEVVVDTEETVTEDSGETPDGSSETVNTEEADESGEEEIVIEIAGDSPDPEDKDEKREAPQWVKDIRKENRELKKQLKAQKKEKENAEIVLGKEPEIDDPEIDYDKAKFKAKWDKWNSEKLAYEKQEEKRKAEEKRQQDQWEETQRRYNERKASLKVDDYDEVEDLIGETLNTVQQNIVLSGADDPAVVFLALSKNSSHLERLSKIEDPVKFAFAVAKLEKDMKVTRRRASTQPERKIKGGSVVVDGDKKHLDKLREEAERTNDYSKVHAYKKRMRAAKG